MVCLNFQGLPTSSLTYAFLEITDIRLLTVPPYDDSKPVAGESSKAKHCDLHPSAMMQVFYQPLDSNLPEDDPVLKAVESPTHLEKYMSLWIEADFFGMAGLCQTITHRIKQELIGATYSLTVFRTDIYPSVEGQMEAKKRSMLSSFITDLQKAVPLAYKVPGPAARGLQLHFVACVVSAGDHLKVPALKDLMATHSAFAEDMFSCLTRMSFKNAASDDLHIRTSMRARVGRQMTRSQSCLYECMSPGCQRSLSIDQTMSLDHWSHGETRWCGSCGLGETKRAAENFVTKTMEGDGA